MKSYIRKGEESESGIYCLSHSGILQEGYFPEESAGSHAMGK